MTREILNKCFMKIILIILLLTACVSQPQLYGANKTDNFARNITLSEEFSLEKKWPGVLKRQPIISSKGIPKYEDLILVQTSCNNFNWAHKNEEWSTPLEAQSKGWGDCKDAAICKYYKLRALGWKPEQLNLWSGWYGTSYQEHLTLAVRLGNSQYILDDMYDKPILAKEYMHKVFDPYSRFNEVGWDF